MAGNPFFHRLGLITGGDGLAALAQTRVIVFGVGGVGSWAAEALARSGVGAITLVDHDVVSATNVNRQVQATAASIGRPKVTELAERLRLINPLATVVALQKAFTRASAGEFDLGGFGYVVDAIDSLSNKMDLIITASKAGAKVFSALGASNKLDPCAIRVDSLWNSQGCPLGRYIRKRLRKKGFTGEVTCVYSEENLPLQAASAPAAEEKPNHALLSRKRQINGSAVHVTGAFGFHLAGLVIRDVLSKKCGGPG